MLTRILKLNVVNNPEFHSQAEASRFYEILGRMVMFGTGTDAGSCAGDHVVMTLDQKEGEVIAAYYPVGDVTQEFRAAEDSLENLQDARPFVLGGIRYEDGTWGTHS